MQNSLRYNGTLTTLALAVVFVATLGLVGLVLSFSGFGASAASMTLASLPVLALLAFGAGGAYLLGRGRGEREDSPPMASPFGVVEGRLLVLLGATLPLGEGVAYGAAALLLIRLVGVRRCKFGSAPPLLRALGPGFLLWVGAGMLALGIGGYGWLRPQEVGRILPFVVTPLVAFAAFGLERKWHQRALQAFCVSLAISCGLALVQHLLVLEPDSPLMEFVGRFSSRTQVRAPGQGNRLAAGGFYFHRLKMAHVLICGVAVLFCRQTLARLSSRERALEGAVGLLFISVLFFTYTRAALLGVVAGAAVVVWFASKRWKVGSLVGAMVILGVATNHAPIRERIISIVDQGASRERSLIWSTAIEIISEHPAGVGLGNYPSLIDSRYQGVEGAERLPRTYAHNLILSAWAETGPLGLLGYLWIWVLPGFTCWQWLRKRSSIPDPERWIPAAGLMVLVSLWVVGMTHDVLYHKPVSLTFAAFLGLLSARLSPGGVASKASGSGVEGSSPG